MHKMIKNFISLVRNANLRKENSIKLSIDEANKLQTEITLLLVELKEQQSETKTLDGGKF